VRQSSAESPNPKAARPVVRKTRYGLSNGNSTAKREAMEASSIEIRQSIPGAHPESSTPIFKECMDRF
jgi:hypothetical protein